MNRNYGGLCAFPEFFGQRGLIRRHWLTQAELTGTALTGSQQRHSL